MTKAIDQANMDLDVKPGDDFFRYVNGGWMASNPILPGICPVMEKQHPRQRNDEAIKRRCTQPG